MFGTLIRRVGFWTLDALKGGKIRKKYKQFLKIKENETTNSKALSELLSFAIATVPAYSTIQEPEITQFPVVNKDAYRAAFDSYRSKNYLDDAQLHKVFTSGSTGNPFMAYQNRNKIYHHKAGLLAINAGIGWNLGDRYMFLRAWGGAHASGKLNHWMQNTVPIDVNELDDVHLEKICQSLLKDKQIKVILGYASALDVIVNYLDSKGHTAKDFRIHLVVADSECLKTEVKKRIESIFGCPVLDRYANNENGILALATSDNDCYEVNWPEYYVELLKLDSDAPVAQGETGRIVITDLYNKAFPFIRYDTGDLGVASKMCGNQVLELWKLIGRISDMLTDIKGNALGESVITAAFEDEMSLRCYQIIQHKDGYDMRIEKPFNGSLPEMEKKLHRLFGEDAQIAIILVDKILLGKNGKLKTTIHDA